MFSLKMFVISEDYSRSEHLQFEDDEYYYYVKAIPKRYVSVKAKTVKKISANSRNRRAERDQVTRQELMEDMDIDMDDE